MKKPIDFAKVFSLGREVRYGDGSIYMGFSPKKIGGLHTSAWVNDSVLGQYCFLETSDEHIAGTVSTHEIGTENWSIVLQIDDSYFWETSRTVLARSFVSKNNGKDFGFCRPAKAVFFGDYDSYERDMTLFRIFIDDDGSLIRMVELREERNGNVFQILHDSPDLFYRDWHH